MGGMPGKPQPIAMGSRFHRFTSNTTTMKSLCTFLILSICCIEGFISRLFAIIRFESIIHEFDPWFNYRATKYLTDHTFHDFRNWFDERAWYPLGRIVGGTVYPGLMLTSGFFHYVLQLLHIPIHIREICVFLAPLFSGLTAIATYLLTKELWSHGAGLFAAYFICIVPGYISRSVAGSYDNEGIAIFALMFTYFLWIKAVKNGSVMWAVLCALSYLYMAAAWGGYVFIINLIPLHVFTLVLMGRYSIRIYVAYTTFYINAVLMAMCVPFIGFQPVKTSEHMAAAGVFLLLNAYAVLMFLKTRMTAEQFKLFFLFGFLIAGGLILCLVVVLTWIGFVAPWSGRFYSLWDTGYAKIHIPIITSVSEHQPTTWSSMFFDMHILICMFPAGAFFCVKELNDERVFIVLYAVFASYFAGVMVRLILTLSPCVCILAAIAFSKLFDRLLAGSPAPTDQKVAPPPPSSATKRSSFDPVGSNTSTSSSKLPRGNETDGSGNQLSAYFKHSVVLILSILLILFTYHCTWVSENAYSSPSVVLSGHHQHDGSRWIIDDFREAYYWLSQNTDDKARIMSWWDYGYQIAGMGNRTTLVDNNTWNNSHIALVGKAMSSNETVAYKIMRSLDVDYVLVIFGGVVGYSGDDINKFLWMVRIAEGEYPNEIRESDYFTPQGEYRIDSQVSKTMMNSLMYKLSYWRFGERYTRSNAPPGYDSVRNAEIGHKNVRLRHVEEAFTSEHWLVRIYRVKPLINRHRRRPWRKIPKVYGKKTMANRQGFFGKGNTFKVVKARRPFRVKSL